MSLLSVSTSTLNSLSFTSRLGSGASEGGGVTVDLDATFVVQIALFVVLLLVLKPLLFDPMLKLFEEREKRIEGTKQKAAKIDAKSATTLQKYEAILTKARDAGAVERDALRAEGARKEAEVMARVRAMTTSTIEQGRATTSVEAKEARAELNVEAASLGRAIAARVLGREVSP